MVNQFYLKISDNLHNRTLSHSRVKNEENMVCLTFTETHNSL